VKVGFSNNLQYLMNNLIDSSGPRGKVVQNEEIYLMVWVWRACVKNHVVYSNLCAWKSQRCPLVANFFQISLRPWGPWVKQGYESERPSNCRSDWPPLTLYNRGSNFIGQQRPCFLRCANVHIDHHGTLEKRHRMAVFKSIRLTVA